MAIPRPYLLRQLGAAGARPADVAAEAVVPLLRVKGEIIAYKPYKIPTFGYPKLRLNLIIEYTDGSIQRINSDEKWRLTAQGPIPVSYTHLSLLICKAFGMINYFLPGIVNTRVISMLK